MVGWTKFGCSECTDCRSQKAKGYPLSNQEDYLSVSKVSFYIDQNQP